MFALSMILWWVFGPHSDLTSWYRFNGEQVVVTGTVFRSYDTGYTIGGDEDSPGTPIYEIHYQFRTSEGFEYPGTCYTTGVSYAEKQAVRVEYLGDPPTASRIVGARTALWPWWGVFSAIIPVAALVMAAFALRAGLRRVRLLRTGKTARAKLISKEPTRTRINGKPVMWLNYEFQVNGVTHKARTSSHKPEKLVDEAEELLIYDPDDPKHSILVDALPGKISVDDDGTVHPAPPGAALARLLAPGFALGGHGIYALVVYLV